MSMEFINDSEKATGVSVEGVPVTSVAEQKQAPVITTETATTTTEVAKPAQTAQDNPPVPVVATTATTENDNKSAEQTATQTEQTNTPPSQEAQLTAEQTKAAEKEAIVKEATDALLKSLGVNSVEDLQQKINPPAALTPEQIKRNDDIKKASIQEFAVRNLEMKPEEFVQIENIKSMSDKDLVFKNFKEAWMADNKDNPDFKDKDLDAEVEYEFNEMFHVNSENARVKKIAEDTIKKTAEGIRGEFQAKYDRASKEFESNQTFKTNVANFKGVLKSELASLPKEIVFDIEGDEKMKFSLDKMDLKDLERFLVNDSNLNYFVQKGGQETSTRLKGLINEYIKLKHYDDVVNTSIKTALAVGTRKATVGAKAPFEEKPIAVATDGKTNDYKPEDLQKIRGVFGR